MAALFDTRDCEPGRRVAMRDGSIVEITENPRDGVWMFGRPVRSDGSLAEEGTVYVDDVDHALPQADTPA